MANREAPAALNESPKGSAAGTDNLVPFYTTGQTGRLSRVFFNACEWRRLNPEIWASWVAAAKNEAEHQRRFSMQYLSEETRRFDRVNRIGESVLVNNSHRPIWARMLATEHPEVRPFIVLRRSCWDADFPNLGSAD